MPSQISRCDECKQDKPIVIVCMIGARLCADCQATQNRISNEELTAYVFRNLEIA